MKEINWTIPLIGGKKCRLMATSAMGGRGKKRLAMPIPKPWRGPKDPQKMAEGKEAREKGGKYQKEVADYLGMVNLWPLPGIDIADREIFGISTKILGSGFPETVEVLLREAEFHTRKKIPGSVPVLVIGKEKGKRYTGDDLCIVRLNLFKWIVRELRELKELRERNVEESE